MIHFQKDDALYEKAELRTSKLILDKKLSCIFST